MNYASIFPARPIPFTSILVAGLLVTALSGWGAPAITSAVEKPNVLIILVDDMGYGDPGCYNSESQIETPAIDRLAREGMRFTDAHAPGPLCHMSRYGLLTGVYPFRTNVGLWRKQPLIKDGQLTIATLLKGQGYQTAMVGKWHLGFLEDGYDRPLPGGPVDRGFGSFFGIRASTDIPPYFYIRDDRAVAPPTKDIAARATPGWSPIQGEFWRAGKIAPDLELADVLPRFTQEANSVLTRFAQRRDQPFLLYWALPAPHTPWLPAADFQGQSKAGMYGDFAMMVDAMVGQVLHQLDELQLSENTLVIFTSDNGPVWYEKDVARFDHDSSGGLRGMKGDAWECGHRMPFIVRWPGHVPSGAVTHHTICFTDVLATLASVTGEPLSAEHQLDSVNFSSVLAGDAETTPRESLVMRSANGTMVCRSGDWKLIEGLGSGGFSKPSKVKAQPGQPTAQLYNLATDLGETDNLFDSHPDQVKRLRQILKQTVDSHPAR